MRSPRPLQKLPGNPGDPVDPQDAAVSVAKNYTISRKNSVQLEDLQGWITKQIKASKDVHGKSPTGTRSN